MYIQATLNDCYREIGSTGSGLRKRRSLARACADECALLMPIALLVLLPFVVVYYVVFVANEDAAPGFDLADII